MDELLTRLRGLLKDRYDVLREIGQGGMATVYVARDLRHPRQVAIKVFRHELAAGVGADRFLREIALASPLSHPNIVPLYDSGDVDGLLYYVMPFVDGESVGRRIARSGQFPIDEALEITRQVAAALHYSHGVGIVHRDVKPDNIMLSGGHALVTDFGIAHAMDRSGDKNLTATGFSVGTPTYMSPEQISGGNNTDARSDVYSLGCVLYAMLIGEAPFTGPSAQAVLARHLAESVPSLRVVRPTIPPAVEAAVHRALAKSPVDRFATAAEFAEAISPAALSQHASVPVETRAPRRRAWLGPAITVLAIATAAVVLRPWSLVRRPGVLSADAHVVAVPPFHSAGVTDSASQRLIGGISDLVVQRLPGDGGPRAVVTGTRPLDDKAELAAARAIGAGQLIHGNVSSVAGRLIFSATLKSVPNDSILAQVDGLTGARDSLPIVLDRLVVLLLAQSVRIPDAERVALARLSLPALRSYFAAERAFVHGQFNAAGRLYEAVLSSDSTCYPAAFGLGAVAMVLPDSSRTHRAHALAKMQESVMSREDSFFLHAVHWQLEHNTGIASRLQRADTAASGPPQAIRWYLFAERLFHDGPLLGVADARERAARSYERALELEPDFLPALGRSIDLAAARGDTATVRNLAPRYFALDSTSDLAEYYRWRVAVAVGDKRELRAVQSRFAKLPRRSLERVVNVAQLDGVGLPDALLAGEALWKGSARPNETRWAVVKQRELALNRGRPAEAAALLDSWLATIEFRPRDAQAEIINAIYWGADTTFPVRWLAPLGGASIPVAARDAATVDCAVNLWNAVRGAVKGVAEGVRRLRTRDGDDPRATEICATMIEAQLAQRVAATDAKSKLVRLDSIAATAPPVSTWLLVAANLTAARLWEASGSPERALAAVRRRPYVADIGEPRVLVGLSTMLREEGRLAAMTGDTAGAIIAYRRYLALRENPEPAVAAEVATIRDAHARLNGRSGKP